MGKSPFQPFERIMFSLNIRQKRSPSHAEIVKPRGPSAGWLMEYVVLISQKVGVFRDSHSKNSILRGSRILDVTGYM